MQITSMSELKSMVLDKRLNGFHWVSNFSSCTFQSIEVVLAVVAPRSYDTYYMHVFKQISHPSPRRWSITSVNTRCQPVALFTLLYSSSYPDCPSCLAHLNSIGSANSAIWAAIKKYSQTYQYAHDAVLPVHHPVTNKSLNLVIYI